MGQLFDALTDTHREWIAQQHMFFVATAPRDADGRVNVSPKGYDTFRVLDASRVAYLDLTGSGIETAAHLADNGRITVMFCAFEGAPRILRLYGRGSFVGLDDEGAGALLAQMLDGAETPSGLRGVVVVDVEQVLSSCGYSIPFMEYAGERDTLDRWATGKTDDELDAYRSQRNATSLDGLPGIG